MNKYTTFGVIAFIELLTTYFVDITIGSTTGGASTGATGAAELTAGTAMSMAGTFVDILLFRVEGLPAIINFGFIALTLIVAYMLLDLIVTALPF